MKALSKKTVSSYKGSACLLELKDVLNENYVYDLETIINHITFIFGEYENYKKSVFINLVKLLCKSYPILYISTKANLDIIQSTNIVYEDIDNIRPESIMKMVNETNSKILVIDEFHLLLNYGYEELFSLLHYIGEQGITIIINSELSCIDEIIMYVENLGGMVIT